jgi:hypothetical protein
LNFLWGCFLRLLLKAACQNDQPALVKKAEYAEGITGLLYPDLK